MRGIAIEPRRDFTRPLLVSVWTVALIALAAWCLLAWGGYALLSDSGAQLFALAEPWMASAVWEQRLLTLLSFGERIGTVALWAVWALGAVGLVLTSTFATLLYRRARRAMG